MSVIVQAIPAAESFAPSDGLVVNVYPEGNRCIVHLAGELDIASRPQLVTASTAGNHQNMVIDLSGVTFMDCCGYGSLLASRLALERAGRTLIIKGQTGQPARLMHLIASLERFAAA